MRRPSGAYEYLPGEQGRVVVLEELALSKGKPFSLEKRAEIRWATPEASMVEPGDEMVELFVETWGEAPEAKAAEGVLGEKVEVEGGLRPPGEAVEHLLDEVRVGECPGPSAASEVGGVEDRVGYGVVVAQIDVVGEAQTTETTKTGRGDELDEVGGTPADAMEPVQQIELSERKAFLRVAGTEKKKALEVGLLGRL